MKRYLRIEKRRKEISYIIIFYIYEKFAIAIKNFEKSIKSKSKQNSNLLNLCEIYEIYSIYFKSLESRYY